MHNPPTPQCGIEKQDQGWHRFILTKQFIIPSDAIALASISDSVYASPVKLHLAELQAICRNQAPSQ